MFKRLYIHNDQYYILNRSISTHNFENKGEVDLEYVKLWRDYLGCDHVLRTQTHFLFVETLPEYEFEEIKEEIKTIK